MSRGRRPSRPRHDAADPLARFDDVERARPAAAACRARAVEVGPACALFIDALLGDWPFDRLRSAQGVLRFIDRYGAARVDAACARAHAVGEYRYHTIKAILVDDLDRQPLPGLTPMATATTTASPRHARP